MKWTKRAAALLASLLFLLIAVQAKGPLKATRPSEGLIRSESAREEQEARKIPILPLLPAEDDAAWQSLWNEAESSTGPVLPILPSEKDGGQDGEEEPIPVLEDEEEIEAAPQDTGDSGESPAVTSPALTERPESRSGLLFPEAEDWKLRLVNPWNELPEDYDLTLKALSNGMKVDERIYDDLNAMLQACQDAGLSPKICSAYRTQAKQTYLYNNKIARLRNAGYSKKAAVAEAGRWVARPGTSEHQLGLALDIVSSSYQGLTKKQEQTAEQKWLMEHCWEYGFILRYPNDKSEITGIGYEPWHYRYVGRDVAMDMRDSGLCFEEYLLLREEALAATP